MGAGQTSQGEEFTLTNSATSLSGIPQRQQETWSASVISRRSNLMQLPELAGSTTLQWTLLVAGLFAGFIVALLGFVYLKAKADLTARSDRMIASQIVFSAHLSPERRLDESGGEKQAVRLIALTLPTGDVLAIGRNIDEVTEIAHLVGRALALGLIPAVL